MQLEFINTLLKSQFDFLNFLKPPVSQWLFKIDPTTYFLHGLNQIAFVFNRPVQFGSKISFQNFH